MTDEKIIQLMPIGEHQDARMFDYEETDRDGVRSSWHVVGAALTDNGRVLPLFWDGYWSFKVIDPARIEFEDFMHEFFNPVPKADPDGPQYEIE